MPRFKRFDHVRIEKIGLLKRLFMGREYNALIGKTGIVLSAQKDTKNDKNIYKVRFPLNGGYKTYSLTEEELEFTL